MADSTYTTIPEKAPDLYTHVYEIVRDAVLTGRFGPGVQLKERALAAELGVSRTPLRQALARLTADGLLEQVAKVGVFVRKLGYKETLELLGVRRILEAGAAAAASDAISDETARELMELAEQVDAAVTRRDMLEGHYLELDFHRRVLQIADNSELQRMAENTKALYFTLGAIPKEPTALNLSRDMSVSHTEVARAIAGGLPELAFKAMWEHFEVVCKRLREHGSKNKTAPLALRNDLRPNGFS